MPSLFFNTTQIKFSALVALLFFILNGSSQTCNYDSLFIYGSKFGVRISNQLKDANGKDSLLIMSHKPPHTFSLWDRHSTNFVEQSGGQAFSLYDVLKVAGPRKIKRLKLKRVLAELTIDSAQTLLAAIYLKGHNCQLPVSRVNFRIISKSDHFEYFLSFPHQHRKLYDLTGSRAKGTVLIIDSISFIDSHLLKDKEMVYYLPYEFIIRL
ncbi:MAG: hypothetical protein IT236_10650 [Bacteroidia bacterium]|nr:hypothetical protein [Bacteroidia bacterium]